MVNCHTDDGEELTTVNMNEAKTEAYKAGHSIFSSHDTVDSREEAARLVSGYQSHSGVWDRTNLPNLRKLAGYDDMSGVGTYTDGDVLVQPDNMSDPCGAKHLLDDMIEAFESGAVDALLNPLTEEK